MDHTAPRWGRFTAEGIYFAAFALVAVFFCAMLVPLASGGPLKDFALEHSEDLREHSRGVPAETR